CTLILQRFILIAKNWRKTSDRYRALRISKDEDMREIAKSTLYLLVVRYALRFSLRHFLVAIFRHG
ncbi:MAG: hypothetical protein KGM99_18600, partial [Burkholderiales bacterium]|nr:hypothetical protein [Burkholderiales bacterium]